jgi:hypothetical protein
MGIMGIMGVISAMGNSRGAMVLSETQTLVIMSDTSLENITKFINDGHERARIDNIVVSVDNIMPTEDGEGYNIRLSAQNQMDLHLFLEYLLENDDNNYIEDAYWDGLDMD